MRIAAEPAVRLPRSGRARARVQSCPAARCCGGRRSTAASVRRTPCRWRRRRAPAPRDPAVRARDPVCRRRSARPRWRRGRPRRARSPRSVPPARPRASRSSRPGSMIGDRPALIMRDLVRTDIDADDLVTVAREAARRDASDVAETKNRDFHECLLEAWVGHAPGQRCGMGARRVRRHGRWRRRRGLLEGSRVPRTIGLSASVAACARLPGR